MGRFLGEPDQERLHNAAKMELWYSQTSKSMQYQQIDVVSGYECLYTVLEQKSWRNLSLPQLCQMAQEHNNYGDCHRMVS